jgi:hypothetical protein
VLKLSKLEEKLLLGELLEDAAPVPMIGVLEEIAELLPVSGPDPKDGRIDGVDGDTLPLRLPCALPVFTE